MPIDYSKFLSEIKQASQVIHDAMDEVKKNLVDDGFNLSRLPTNFRPLSLGPIVLPPGSGLLTLPNGFMHFDYMSGKMFFGRLWDELHKALEAVRNIDQTLASNTSQDSQMAYDQLALRQRKLFEALTLVMMLSRSPIYANDLHPLYFLHYHLQQDRTRLQARNTELKEFFGGDCIETQNLIATIDQLLSELEGHIQLSHCTWNRNEKDKLRNVLPDASLLDKVALGFGYQAVFGAASNQIHLNMSGYYQPATSEGAFLHRADNLLLLCVCIALRLCDIINLSGSGTGVAAKTLRDEFVGIFPDSLASAVLGAAEVGDIVNVFAIPDNFTGIVINKRTNGLFSAYQVEPLHKVQPGFALQPNGTLRWFHQVGRKGWFGDIETMLCLREIDQNEIVKRAIDDNFVTAATGESTQDILARILKIQEGYDKYVHAAMNKTLMPEMFFVQRYLRN